MSKRLIRLAVMAVVLLGLSCVSHRPLRVAGNAGSQTCPSKDGEQTVSVTCWAGFTPECSCASDGHATCHCVPTK